MELSKKVPDCYQEDDATILQCAEAACAHAKNLNLIHGIKDSYSSGLTIVKEHSTSVRVRNKSDSGLDQKNVIQKSSSKCRDRRRNYSKSKQESFEVPEEMKNCLLEDNVFSHTVLQRSISMPAVLLPDVIPSANCTSLRPYSPDIVFGKPPDVNLNGQYKSPASSSLSSMDQNCKDCASKTDHVIRRKSVTFAVSPNVEMRRSQYRKSSGYGSQSEGSNASCLSNSLISEYSDEVIKSTDTEDFSSSSDNESIDGDVNGENNDEADLVSQAKASAIRQDAQRLSSSSSDVFAAGQLMEDPNYIVWKMENSPKIHFNSVSEDGKFPTAGDNSHECQPLSNSTGTDTDVKYNAPDSTIISPTTKEEYEYDLARHEFYERMLKFDNSNESISELLEWLKNVFPQLISSPKSPFYQSLGSSKSPKPFIIPPGIIEALRSDMTTAWQPSREFYERSHGACVLPHLAAPAGLPCGFQTARTVLNSALPNGSLTRNMGNGQLDNGLRMQAPSSVNLPSFQTPGAQLRPNMMGIPGQLSKPDPSFLHPNSANHRTAPVLAAISTCGPSWSAERPVHPEKTQLTTPVQGRGVNRPLGTAPFMEPTVGSSQGPKMQGILFGMPESQEHDESLEITDLSTRIRPSLVEKVINLSQCSYCRCSLQECVQWWKDIRSLKEALMRGAELSTRDRETIGLLCDHYLSCDLPNCQVPWCRCIFRLQVGKEKLQQTLLEMLSNPLHTLLPDCEPTHYEFIKLDLSLPCLKMPKEWDEWIVIYPMSYSCSVTKVVPRVAWAVSPVYWIVKLSALHEGRNQINVLRKLRDVQDVGIVRHLWAATHEPSTLLVVCTQFVSNFTLRDVLDQKGRLSVTESCHQMRQILEALQFLHQRHIVYLNWSCSNLLLDKHGVKISNFTSSADLSSKTADDDIIKMSLPVDVVPYELIKESADISLKSDMWGLACILHEMLTGQRPWFHLRHDRQEDIWAKIKVQVEKDKVDLNEELSHCASTCILSCLKKGPEERPSVQDLAQHIQVLNGTESRGQ